MSRAPATIVTDSTREGRDPLCGGRHNLRGAVHPPRKPFGPIADVPCHVGQGCTDFVRSDEPTPRTLFTDSAPTPPLPRPGTPSTDRSRLSPTPCWREGRDPVGRHWYLGFAAETQLPTCIHELAHAFSLDPPCLAGCSPEQEGRMPSIDFCNRMDPRAHLANLPNPAGCRGRSLTCR